FITLFEDVRPTDRKVTVRVRDGFKLHNPQFPSLNLLNSVSSSVVFNIPALEGTAKKKTGKVVYKDRSSDQTHWAMSWTIDELLALWIEPEPARDFTPTYNNPQEKAIAEAQEAAKATATAI